MKNMEIFLLIIIGTLHQHFMDLLPWQILTYVFVGAGITRASFESIYLHSEYKKYKLYHIFTEFDYES